MKICHILWGLTYGGIETMVINIANCQAAMGHDVHLVIVNDMVDAPLLAHIADGVTFHNARRRVGSKNPWPLMRLNLLLWRLRPDVTHFHHVRLHNYFLRPLLGRWCTTHHIDCVPHLLPYIKGNPNLFSISNMVREDILRHTGADSVVVMNGIDSSEFRVKELPYSGGRPLRIVQVGRLDIAQKGQDLLVDAVAILRDRGVAVTVDFIGEGRSRDELEARIGSRGVADRVTLLGARPPEYIARNLCDYDLLVQPSRFEGFGLTIAEGMAAGVPVLVSDIDVQLEVTDHGRCGYTFRSGDTADLADAIARIVAGYDMSRAREALQLVRSAYDVRVTAARYIGQYRRIIAED